MNQITRKEYNYLIKLLEEYQGSKKILDIEIDTAELDKTELYFLQQKLEKLRDNA